ncbi:MAG: chromate transporter [candidate division NC10 bacterium RIFCSPLOWO2_12_FULL_66_18]|nr:MAG: chromate transporter [candidate division NC10 bacterium RIFCSPLOWO2_12_FULL_66_18]
MPDEVKGRATDSHSADVPLWRFLLYFLYLGTCGFGGPIALAGYMQRDLEERRGWITPEDYRVGLALAQLAPGPLAAQLAIYLGYVRGGFWGATMVGAFFIVPSFIMVVILGALYVRYGGLWWMQALFYGIGACVIGIIVRAAYKLTRSTIKMDALLWTIFAVMAASTAWAEQEIIWLFILCGFVALFVKAPPARVSRWISGSGTPLLAVAPFLHLTQGLLGPVSGRTMGNVLWFFIKAGAFVFGSGLAIVPFLYGGVVQEYGWLNDRQFLDAVAVAMITPGPVVITVGFIGYLVAGLYGAAVAAFGVFLPVYLFVIIPSPWFKRHMNQPQLSAFVAGVTAAATGAIAGAAFVLGRRAIIDIPTGVIALLTLGVVWRWKVPEPLLIAAAGIAGLLLFRS